MSNSTQDIENHNIFNLDIENPLTDEQKIERNSINYSNIPMHYNNNQLMGNTIYKIMKKINNYLIKFIN
jgi:hypothetical protein